jgi:hypothetical protein
MGNKGFFTDLGNSLPYIISSKKRLRIEAFFGAERVFLSFNG